MTLIDRAIGFLTDRARAYRQIPDVAMNDLARFCRATESAAVPGDHDRTWAMIGRREVWLRIAQHRNMTPEQLFDLYGGVAPKEQGK